MIGSARRWSRGFEPDVARSHHHRLALVLEASGQADPEVLGLHFLGAGLPERAAEFFVVAADQAAEMLAFECAATLYRRALEHQPPPSKPGGGPSRAPR